MESAPEKPCLPPQNSAWSDGLPWRARTAEIDGGEQKNAASPQRIVEVPIYKSNGGGLWQLLKRFFTR